VHAEPEFAAAYSLLADARHVWGTPSDKAARRPTGCAGSWFDLVIAFPQHSAADACTAVPQPVIYGWSEHFHRHQICGRGDRMNSVKRLGSIVAFAIIPIVSVEMTAHAGVVSGEWYGLANINVQEYVDNTLVTSIMEANVPSTITFSLATTPPVDAMLFVIDNSVFPVVFLEPALTSIIDGIPGVSADYASGSAL
jgi:hypothetical protein